MQFLRLGAILALTGLADAFNFFFLEPPDVNSGVQNYDLTYAFGDYLNAQWVSNFEYITLQLMWCDRANVYNVTGNTRNENNYTFLLGPDFVSNCPDYMILVTEVTDISTGALGWSITTQNFRILNQTDPPVTKGTYTETFYSSGTVGSGATVTVTQVATASFTPVFNQAALTSSILSQAVSSTSAASSVAPTISSTAETGASTGLSEDAKIGLGIGVGLGVPLLVAVAVTVWFTMLRRRKSPASRLMDNYGVAVGALSHKAPEHKPQSSMRHELDTSIQPRELP